MPENISTFNLALLGTEISHSKSPEYYKRVFKNLNRYDLLDVQTPPALHILSKNYQAINITTPFKRSYLSQVKLIDVPKDINAINLIIFKSQSILATNTDYLALKKLIPQYTNKKEIIIFGDGVMSNVVQKILQKMNLNYKLYSRKLIPNFSDLNLSTYKSQAVLINCCTRDFVFKGNIPDNISIFDLNYGETPFISYCLKNNLELLDGRELFELQAFYASDILRKELLVE